MAHSDLEQQRNFSYCGASVKGHKPRKLAADLDRGAYPARATAQNSDTDPESDDPGSGIEPRVETRNAARSRSDESPARPAGDANTTSAALTLRFRNVLQHFGEEGLLVFF